MILAYVKNASLLPLSFGANWVGVVILFPVKSVHQNPAHGRRRNI
jgi:hypothetical protein